MNQRARIKPLFNHIDVFFDDVTNPKISADDTGAVRYTTGAASLELWNTVTPAAGPSYNMSVSDLIMTPIQ